jgi:hypothetical protein
MENCEKKEKMENCEKFERQQDLCLVNDGNVPSQLCIIMTHM